jgi:hypothetical protein
MEDSTELWLNIYVVEIGILSEISTYGATVKVNYT